MSQIIIKLTELQNKLNDLYETYSITLLNSTTKKNIADDIEINVFEHITDAIDEIDIIIENIHNESYDDDEFDLDNVSDDDDDF